MDKSHSTVNVTLQFALKSDENQELHSHFAYSALLDQCPVILFSKVGRHSFMFLWGWGKGERKGGGEELPRRG